MRFFPAADLLQEAPVLNPGDYGATFARMFLTLTCLVLLLVLTYWFIRRMVQQRLQKGGALQSIQVVEKRMISPKTTLYLVEVEKNKRILMAESQLEIKKLLESELHDEAHLDR